MLPVKIEGISTTVRRLNSLERRVAKRVAKKAVRAGGREHVKELRRQVPVDTGWMRKNITIRVGTRGGRIQSRVGAKSNKDPRTGRNAVHYVHLVERGTRPHAIPGHLLVNGAFVTDVQHPGAKANDAFARAARIAESRALDAFTRKLRDEVEAETRNLAAGG